LGKEDMQENQVLVSSFTAEGEEKGRLALPAETFGAKVNVFAVSEVVRNHLANLRQGTASVKGRSDVSGGGRKPWRQKGLGRARSGTNTSPVWVGGGRAFGPRPRDYSYRVPRKLKRVALRSALSSKVKEGNLITIEEPRWETPRTKQVAELVAKLGLSGKKCLMVLSETKEAVVKSVRNLPDVRTINSQELNAFEVADCQVVVFTEKALERFMEVHKV